MGETEKVQKPAEAGAASEPAPAYEPSPSLPPAHVEQTSRPPASNPSSRNDLAITLDKDLVFPLVPPATALYSLNFTLQTRGRELVLYRSVPTRSHSAPTEKELYSIKRAWQSERLTFEFKGMRKSAYASKLVMKFTIGMGGLHWEVKEGEDGNVSDPKKSKGKPIILKSRGKEWRDVNGRVVALEGFEGMREMEGFEPQGPVLRFASAEEDEKIKDLVVAAWLTRLWSAELKKNKSVAKLPCM